MQNNDRRRLNAPAGGTSAPVYIQTEKKISQRTREPQDHRRIFLRTNVVPSAAGSAYYELEPDQSTTQRRFDEAQPSLKLSVTVHGPQPLPRNAAFSPNLLLTTNVKFAPFATRNRRGYVRDGNERDLGVHLENALRGIVIGERWPKSAVDVVVTILEGADPDEGSERGLGLMTALAGMVTASCAALAEAGIDCVDLVSGGVAGITESQGTIVDPVSSDQQLQAVCCVAYLESRDEITELWQRGDPQSHSEALIDQAVAAAKLQRTVLVETVKEMVEMQQSNMPNGEIKKG